MILMSDEKTRNHTAISLDLNAHSILNAVKEKYPNVRMSHSSVIRTLANVASKDPEFAFLSERVAEVSAPDGVVL